MFQFQSPSSQNDDSLNKLPACCGRSLFIVRLSKNVRLLQGEGKFQIRALRTDEERRRFRSPPDYPPTGPSGSLNSELEDDLELPMLRGSNRRCVNFHLKLLLPKPLQDHETHLVIE